jgi:hypothetical protein
MLGAALTVGVTPVEVKEILYQAVPYVGMGKVFDFLHATNEVLSERGVELPREDQSTTTPETRAERGPAVQKQIVGADIVDRMYAAAAADDCSPWRCSSRSADASRKSEATSRRTSTSATTAPCSLPSSPNCCPSSAIRAP